MTSTVTSNLLDTLGVISAAVASIHAVIDPGTALPPDKGIAVAWLLLASISFILSFGMRLLADGRIDKLLNGIRDKVRR